MQTMKTVFIATMAVCIANASFGYKVWLGTHKWEHAAAENLDQWDMAIDKIDGINYVLLDARPKYPDGDGANTSDWNTMIGRIDQSIPGMAEIARSQYVPAHSRTLAERMENEFATVENRGGEIDIMMLYDEEKDGTVYKFNLADVQDVRDWLDNNGHSDVTLVFNLRNNDQERLALAQQSIIDGIMIEASATRWVEDRYNVHTLLQDLWTDPSTSYKNIYFQIPRHETPNASARGGIPTSPINQYIETRRALWVIKDLMGDAFMQSDQCIFIVCNYGDTFPTYPETEADDTRYVNTKSGVALALIEQRDIFEGRIGVVNEALCVSYERTAAVVPAPTYGNGGTPGTGDPWTINSAAPARIEAENFDQGDALAVYYDTTSGNAGGAYRATDVDIGSGDGGYVVGWTIADEWLQYTVDVEEAGIYDLTIRYSRAAAGDSILRLSANGADISGDIAAPSTGAFSTFDTVTTSVVLTAGTQALRLHFIDGGINVNWMELAAGTTPVVTLTTLNTPVELTDGSVWSDGQPAHGGADYVVPDTGNLKSPDGTSSFPGFSLTVEAGGKFQFRGKEELGQKTTVNGLIASGGTPGTFVNLAAGTGNNTVNHLDGTLQNDGFTRLSGYGNATGPRNIRISSLISGNGTLHSTGTSAYPHTCTIGNAANTFAGVWESDIGTLEFETAGAVGSADIEVHAEGKLRIADDWSAGATLTVADSSTAEVDVGTYIWTVSNLVIGAVPVADGLYTMTELNALAANPVFTGSGKIRVGPPPVYELIAGWDVWDSGASPNANLVAANVTGSAVTTSEDPTRPWHTTDERGASDDGTWGTHAGPPGADTTVGPDTADNLNLELPNAVTGGTITFTVANNGAADIELEAFHFDAYAFRSKAARTYTLSVLAGSDITVGMIYSSSAQEITEVGGAWDNGAHDDIDHSLLGLADHTLGAGESVQFRLTFSGGAGDASGGHDLWVDNVGITGAFASAPPVDPPVLEHEMSGGDIVFSWTGDGFKVQARTNLTEGNWFDVPGGDTPPVNIAPTNPEAYFQLIEQ